jgi:prephenate dehydrogenase
VILATPVGAFAPILRQVAPALGDHSVVTDVGSTKARVVAEAEKILEGKAGRFVGSHPMAGSEKKGPSHASADLYRGALCILTPTDRTDPRALQQVTALWEALGMRLLTLSPEAHDRAVAAVSHVPHALASLLMALPEDDQLPVAATGFADMTRLAAGDPEMWRDIFATNRQAVLSVVRRFARQLGEFEQLLQAGDSDAMEAFLQRAKDRRDAMPLSPRHLPAGDE